MMEGVASVLLCTKTVPKLCWWSCVGSVSLASNDTMYKVPLRGVCRGMARGHIIIRMDNSEERATLRTPATQGSPGKGTCCWGGMTDPHRWRGMWPINTVENH